MPILSLSWRIVGDFLYVRLWVHGGVFYRRHKRFNIDRHTWTNERSREQCVCVSVCPQMTRWARLYRETIYFYFTFSFYFCSSLLHFFLLIKSKNRMKRSLSRSVRHQTHIGIDFLCHWVCQLCAMRHLFGYLIVYLAAASFGACIKYVIGILTTTSLHSQNGPP